MSPEDISPLENEAASNKGDEGRKIERSKSLWICLILCAGILAYGGYRYYRYLNPPVAAAGEFTNSIGMTMVELSTGYYVSKYETTQAEFEEVMGFNPSNCKGADHPVEYMTAAEAKVFCDKLTALEERRGTLPKGYVYDLPTFEQWMEYVADASLKESITGDSGYGYETHQPVTTRGDVNRLGLYNLRGNVMEWSKDRYDNVSNLLLGAWWNECRRDFLSKSNKAGFATPNEKSANVGFRCVLVLGHRTSLTNVPASQAGGISG